MKDYIEIGATPGDEPCEQLGDNYDRSKAIAECRRFIELIRKVFGVEPEGARLAVKGFAHDYGTYHEVICYFDDAFPESVEYAFRVEAEAPINWE